MKCHYFCYNRVKEKVSKCIISRRDPNLCDFSYDYLNRLTEVQKDGAVVGVYGYDSSNRRIVKRFSGSVKHYVYDIYNNLIGEFKSDGTPLKNYVYLNGELVVLNKPSTGTHYFSINDHLGTPQRLVENDGTVAWEATYLPFGEAQITVQAVVNNVRFPGQYFDVETGLHYNWHRFYDPETGRYISADPIGLAGGD